MKVSKIFGVVLSLHVGVIAVLIVQPGCSTSQPPTKTYEQSSTLGTQPSKSLGDLIPATRVEEGIDPAFNANIDGGSNYGFDARQEPLRPAGEFSEFDTVNEPLTPLVDMGPTIDIAGPAYETYTVKKGDSLWAISKRKNVSLSEIYAANGLTKNSVLKIGQQIKIPTDGSTVTASTVTADTYQPTTLNSGTTTHKVRSGDTLSGIARKYGTTVGAIKAANGKTSNVIRIGESLVIPVEGGSATSSAPAPSAPSVAVTANGGRTHTVKSGEYPAKIAKMYGMTADELMTLNGITNPAGLQVGQKLIVSSTGSAANIDTKTETVTAPVARTTTTPTTSKPATTAPIKPAASTGPVEISVVAAEPIVEGGEADAEVDADALFDNAVEIPVIRLDSE